MKMFDVEHKKAQREYEEALLAKKRARLRKSSRRLVQSMKPERK